METGRGLPAAPSFRNIFGIPADQDVICSPELTTAAAGMAGFISGEDRQQAVLFPARLDDLVPGPALMQVIDAFVAGLDLAALSFVRALGIDRPGDDSDDLLEL